MHLASSCRMLPRSTPPRSSLSSNSLSGQLHRLNCVKRHVNIEVVSKLFEGQTSVKRQRLVYKAIWQELQETVHAVDSMKTSTPQEAGLSN
ncbi:hypothetical protein ABBQ32_005792 [Trebouxia sp. C0010 RCD-2024]